jgi:diadenosine tetraphosphatase ApaH/serine/threonine PP2A family protein phosphatase
MERAEQAKFDSVLCCGDVVGYGPEPNEAIDVLRKCEALTIRGNHDRVASGQDDPTDFNVHAARAALWTRNALTEDSVAFLRDLPVGPLAIGDGAELVHGAVTDEDDYIMCTGDAADSFSLTEAPLTFFGHTHFQCVYSIESDGTVTTERVPESDGMGAVKLRDDMQYLVNPGSVGQPRDNDVRAGFAIWDTATSMVEFYRVPYPLELTQEKMRKADLPKYLVERLTHGR